jgi:hypothetical protein
MARFAPLQPDLFAPVAEPEPQRDPLAELEALLRRLRAAEQMPWADAAGAMAEELHALGLARSVGPAADALAAAILRETERLLAASD